MKLTKMRLRVLAAGVVTAAMLALPAVAASAHVRVEADGTAAGGYSQLTFRVPNESANARTTKLKVKLPTTHPFTSVSTKPTPGWTASVEQGKLPKPVTVDGATITKAPRTVTWTAKHGHAIGQSEYQTFTIMVGPLPASGSTVMMPAKQTYSDGSVVSWSQKTKAGAQEPDHPAPTFTTTAAEDAASSGQDSSGQDSSGQGSSGASDPSRSSDSSDSSGHDMSDMQGMDMSGTAASDDTARWLGGIGIGLGIIAVFIALFRRDSGPVKGAKGTGRPTNDNGSGKKE